MTTELSDSQVVTGITWPAIEALGGARTNEAPVECDLTDVLFEQLEYLVRFSDQEGDRLNRVKAILLETFN